MNDIDYQERKLLMSQEAWDNSDLEYKTRMMQKFEKIYIVNEQGEKKLIYNYKGVH